MNEANSEITIDTESFRESKHCALLSYFPFMHPKRKLSSIVSVKFPVDSVRKFKKNESVNSVFQETQHFCTITTCNGPRRIFYGKRSAQIFWTLVVVSVFVFLTYQIIVILKYFFSKPTVSQISFVANNGEMEFPAVTLCSLNSIKTSFIKKLNSSGDLTEEVLNYLLAAKTNAMYMYNNVDTDILKKAHDNAMKYLINRRGFDIVNFLNLAQFDCEELFETCYFKGKEFDCCQFMKISVTSLGKCWELNIGNQTKLWADHRGPPSTSSKDGLQIVANTRLEEQLTNFHYSSFQENGFRFFIHPPMVNPDLASEGVMVSPSRVVNSPIKAVLHDLLDRQNWGNCTQDWPTSFRSSLPYSSSSCQALCLANHFEKHCGCAPYSYNVDNKLNVCLPYEEVSCMKEKMTKSDGNGTTYLDIPFCAECHLACRKTSYTAYTSYGDGFNNNSMIYLLKLTNRSESYILKNIAVINIHFIETFYTVYTQVKATSFQKVLSTIFGLNGLWFGMSVISLIEVFLFLAKITWIMVSRRRRSHLYEKKNSQKKKQKILEFAAKEVAWSKSRNNSSANLVNSGSLEDELYWYRVPENYELSHTAQPKTGIATDIKDNENYVSRL